jgi:hypothetical protein
LLRAGNTWPLRKRLSKKRRSPFAHAARRALLR